MSKIQAELSAATEIEPKRKEERQEFIARLMVGVAALGDAEWEALSQEAQDWFNEAADAKNAKKKEMPDFPDLPEADEPAKEEPKAGRRGTKVEAKEERLTKVGDTATVLTKRGKSVTGVVVEMDKKVIVLEVDGDEQEFDMERVESVTVNHGNADKDDADEAKDAGPGVGDNVVVVTKRGKEVAGKIVEIDDEVLVLDVDGKDEEFSRDRIETIKMAGGKGAAKEEPKAGRRGAKEEPVAKDEAKPKRASNGEVSIGTRIKELIADDLEATEADIAKILKKEGLEFRDNTLKLNYTDAHKFIAILKAAKLIKK